MSLPRPAVVGLDTQPPPGSDPPPLVGFDIETDTSVGGLDPEVAPIVAVAVSTADGDHVLTGDEAGILRRTDALVAAMAPGLLVTWNGGSFDLPFVARRAELLGVPVGLQLTDEPRWRSRREPGRPVVRARWHRLVHLDGYRLYRADVGQGLGLSCGLKPLARLVGMDPVELDREALHLAEPAEVEAYVASDARTAVALVQRRMPLAIAAADYPAAVGGDPRPARSPGSPLHGRPVREADGRPGGTTTEAQ